MDLEIYNDCVKKYADGLYRFAIKSSGSVEEAKDIVQNCFEVLWNERQQVTYEKAKSFLFTIAYRKSMDVHRFKERVQYMPEFKENHLGAVGLKLDEKNLVHIALNQLDEIARSLVVLKDLEGYNYEEMCTITDLNLSQVKVYLHRARKKMKDFILANQ
jgi:RNA polymerase sigma factor (sigma-70 family)